MKTFIIYIKSLNSNHKLISQIIGVLQNIRKYLNLGQFQKATPFAKYAKIAQFGTLSKIFENCSMRQFRRLPRWVQEGWSETTRKLNLRAKLAFWNGNCKLFNKHMNNAGEFNSLIPPPRTTQHLFI